jgi:hypothetical protein
MGTAWKVVHNSGIAADLESQTMRIVVRRPKNMPDADFARFLEPGTYVNDGVLKLIENWDVIPRSVDNPANAIPKAGPVLAPRLVRLPKTGNQTH